MNRNRSFERFTQQVRDRIEDQLGRGYTNWLLVYGNSLGRQSSFEAKSVVAAFAQWESDRSPQNTVELQTAIDDYCRSHPEVNKPESVKNV